MAQERLQKLLAESGVASRRAAERLISDGRVQVNGVVVTRLGALADATSDAISVDGRPIGPPPQHVYLAVNKPSGYVTTSRDDQGRPIVMDLVYKTKARVFPVGRLDRDSEGLLLLTNDGALAQRLTHPSHEVDKEYLALVRGGLDAAALRRLRHGIDIDGRRTAPANAEVVAAPEGLETPAGHAWLRIVLREGRKRQVRRMCDEVGCAVVRLIRTRIGPLRLRGLVPGRVRELTPAEIERLRQAAGLS
jgi:23S rRNA pseudouridine2605 synthase